MTAYVYQEYPKWIVGPDGSKAIVDNAEAEAAQRTAWEAEGAPREGNALLPQLDHDGDGEPGGSIKQDGDEMKALRAAYKEQFGKRAFPGWDAEKIKALMESGE